MLPTRSLLFIVFVVIAGNLFQFRRAANFCIVIASERTRVFFQLEIAGWGRVRHTAGGRVGLGLGLGLGG